jgi:hypothetical protein
MTTVLAVIGSKALWLLYSWLLSAIISQWLSARKGYGEKPGLVTGLLLSVVSIVIWLLWPARADSRWKLQGPLPKRGGDERTVAQLRAEMEDGEKT